jgi:hypothetical protein
LAIRRRWQDGKTARRQDGKAARRQGGKAARRQGRDYGDSRKLIADSGLSRIVCATPVCHTETLIMAIVNRISEQEYRELALSDSDRL